MREFISFLTVFRWPALFVGLFLLTHQPETSAALVVILAFRDDLSIVLRHRHLQVKMPGFEGTVSEDEPPSQTPSAS